ncbi:MbtH family protein [Nonomuraea sp. NPDC050663]|uniref:MbtH family protein n=1 Tax=Nonomuraea sp. NPDC050663 TaxID=3364370 RepID=UPI0037BD7CB5
MTTERGFTMFDHDRDYQVVLNDEGQYSLWPGDRPVPSGWNPDGFTGPKADCLSHIARVWTDLRPASLRAAMEA